MPDRAEASANVARNVVALREVRGWTQQRLATASGVPRATIASLESGSANPTLAVLLDVGLDELVSAPKASARLYRASELRSRQRGEVEVRQLLPDPLPGITVERMAFAPGATMTGAPHTPGTREYLTCERGRVQLTASSERYVLEPGDVVVFRGDQRHAYAEVGGADAVAWSVVLVAT